MKKIITLSIFAIALFFGSQTVSAQIDITEINRIASEKTKELNQKLKFYSDQKEDVYLAIQEYTKVKLTLNEKTSNDENYINKMENNLLEKMKTILNTEQFEHFQKLHAIED